jgi:hypothetical protein
VFSVLLGFGMNVVAALVSYSLGDRVKVSKTLFFVDLCPKPSDKNSKSPLSKQSYFEKLDGGIPGLFNALLEDSDDEKWTAVTFPVDHDSSVYGPNSQDMQFYMRKLRFSLEFSSLFFKFSAFSSIFI